MLAPRFEIDFSLVITGVEGVVTRNVVTRHGMTRHVKRHVATSHVMARHVMGRHAMTTSRERVTPGTAQMDFLVDSHLKEVKNQNSNLSPDGVIFR